LKTKGLFAFLPETQANRSSRVMLFAAVLLAAAFLYLAFRDLDWHVFFAAIKGAQYACLPLVLIWSSASFFTRAFRLRVLLASDRHISMPGVFWANMAGYLGNSILPARAGELARAAYLARRSQVSMSFALAAGLVERLVDLAALVVLGAIALSSIGIIPPLFQQALNVIAIIGAAGLLLIFILPRLEKNINRLILVFPLLKEGHRSKLNIILGQFLSGLRSLHGFSRAAQFTALTGLIWLMDAAGTVLLSHILKIPLSLQQAFVLLAALGLSSAIPSTPGGVGIVQFVAVSVLAPFGISQEDALAFIIISQMLSYLIILFWGMLSLWQFNKRAQP
jgi:uncharacterized protein (TIRG00374 family)